MAETHELRLKINAAAARAGAKEFVAAIRSMQAAVDSLDQRSGTVFTNINKRARGAGTALGALSGQYNTARAANDRFLESVKRANTALQRQIQLAGQVRVASPRVGTPATPQARVNTHAGDQQVSMQNRIQRAVDNTRASVEKLTTSLMQVGGFQSINEISAAFRRFQKEVSGATVSAQQLDSAKTRLNSSLKSAQTSLTTLTAKAREEARAEREAANEVRQRAAATKDAASAASAASNAAKAQAASAAKIANAELAAAQAMRQAEQEAVRLANRLRAMGDTRGITTVDQALTRLRASLGASAGNALKARQAMAEFANTTSKAKVAILQAEGAQQQAARAAKELANEERRVAQSARQVESQMRSVAGASNAAKKAMHDATGSMRGLENAFSGTFQIGSAFRVMLGSITFGAFTQQVFAAGRALQQFQVTMEVATGSMQGAAQQMDFIDGMARRLGISLRTARDDFSKFAVAANLAGVQADTARNIFRSVSEAMTVMGRGAEDQRLAFLALEQMLSKNTISSEELRRQLGERLPGAVNLMAKAVGVTTQELQKLLKEGSLISSEVLPKFAREVDKAFGPGLERALTRAPAALGRLRNEFEFFLSAVADAGFMDALAAGFNRLTDAMRQPGMQEAARNLGAGLTDLAEMAVGFAETFITNIDRVAVAFKAIVVGLITKQVFLLGNALITMGQRAGVGFAALTTATTANTATMAAHTEVLTATAVAETALTTAQAKQVAMTDVQLSAMPRANGVFGATAKRTGLLAGAWTGLGASAGRAAAGLGVFSRILTGLAGPVGLAVTALMLIPVIFGDISNDADSMASQVEAAVKRAGVSFDSFGESAARASSSVALDRTLTDIETLGHAVSAFAEDNSLKVRGLVNALSILRGETVNLVQGYEAIGNIQSLGSIFGVDARLLGTFSRQTRDTVADMTVMTQTALNTGEGFLVLRDRIAEAITKNPSAAPVLRSLAAMTEELALSELALVSNREKLVELYGTSSDRLVKSFADTARSVVATGRGLDDLRSEMSRLSAESPAAAKGVQEVFAAVEKALSTGQSVAAFRTSVLNIFGGAAAEIEKLRRAATEAQKAAGAAGVAFGEQVKESLSNLDSAGLFNNLVDGDVLTQIQTLSSEFQRFKDFSVGVDGLKASIDALDFPSEEAQTFSQALLEQFNALPEGQQTYANLVQIMAQLGDEFPSAEVGAFESQLRAAVRTGQDASLSARDYIEALKQVRASMPTDATKEMVDKLIAAAEAWARDEANARAAGAAMDSAAASALNAGTSALQGSYGVDAMAAAFGRLSAASAGIEATLGAAISTTQERIDIAGLEGSEKAVAQYFASFGEGGKVVSETEAKIAEMRAEMRNLNPSSPEALGMAAMIAEQETNLQSFIATQTSAITKLFDVRAAMRAASSGGSGGGGSAEDAATAAERLVKAQKGLVTGATEYLTSLEEENTALTMLASGMTSSEKAAKLLAAAQVAGVQMTDEQTRAFIAQIEAAERLNAALSQMANDPVNDWMNSVPTWREAGQQIEVGVFNSLSDTISKFIQTGEFSFEELGKSILSTVADIMANMAVKELAALLGGNVSGRGEGGFGLGGILSNLFGNNSIAQPQGDPFAAGFNGDQSTIMQNAMISGGQQAAQAIQTAMVQAGQQVGQQITTGGQQAGAQMQAQVQAGGTAAASQMNTQTTIGGTVAGTQMNTQTTTGGTVAASQMQQAIISGGNVAASQMAQASAGGGGGGHFGGGLGGILLGAGIGLLSSLLNKPKDTPNTPDGPITPVGIRQFAEGTPNTSGIPAILHDNEAVIPLSGGRKVPVEFNKDVAGTRGDRTVIQNFNITTPDADSFRKSQKQIALDAASSGQKALQDNG